MTKSESPVGSSAGSGYDSPSRSSMEILIEQAWMDISSWKERFPGKKAIGVFGPYVPWETVLASGYEPVYLFPENLHFSRSKRLLPAFSCSISKALLDYALSTKKGEFDALLFIQSCDAVRAVADIAAASDCSVPVYFFSLPRRLSGRGADQFYHAELESLSAKLGQASDSSLTLASETAGTTRALLADLYKHRLRFSSFQYYSILRAVHYLPLDYVNTHLEKVVADINLYSPSVPATEPCPLFLVGSHLPGKLLLESVDTAGAAITGEMIDLGLVAIPSSPFEGELLPGIHRDSETRRELFLKKYKNSGARGVLFYRQKFCDPHGFDIAALSELCRTEEIPFLNLELERQSDTGRISTRLEAFLEMLD